MNILVFRIKENLSADQTDKIVKNIVEQIENNGLVFVGPYVDVYVAENVCGTQFKQPYKERPVSDIDSARKFLDKFKVDKPEE